MNWSMEELLRQAHDNNVSDIHMTAKSPIIFRIRGELQAEGQLPLEPEHTEAAARYLMTEEQFEAYDRSGDIDFAYSLEGKRRFRVNVYRQSGAVALAIRPIGSSIPGMGQLGLPGVAERLIMKRQGLLLVTGPTGSGKSTTLASMIGRINETFSGHIVTLEDPIEYVHPHRNCIVNQREIGSDTQSFASGLRSALRQDPDVILVGEMRDLDTIRTAITAAETGHLVLATLHTEGASQAVDRMIDVFPAEQQQQIRYQLSSTLVGVIAQRLLPAADGTSMTAAFEVLVNTPAIANLIRSNKGHQLRSAIQTGGTDGMQTMDSAIRRLVASGMVTTQTARRFLDGLNTGDQQRWE
ncbi:type IV pilus twitching motility protein PilT [Paenibacillus kobensis]|uniref:type IV pilus twitching motility protein PilT n=1 Tax=Paenibacillus kobensis TaxID=59841 RepID=UPI000FDB9DEA|nr:type IV pilus twitching motility protein PilT [Paenibacillus kobensis]